MVCTAGDQSEMYTSHHEVDCTQHASNFIINSNKLSPLTIKQQS